MLWLKLIHFSKRGPWRPILPSFPVILAPQTDTYHDANFEVTWDNVRTCQDYPGYFPFKVNGSPANIQGKIWTWDRYGRELS